MRALILFVLSVAATMAGCIQSAAVPCGDGVCAPGTTCELATGRCISDAQRAVCDGLAEGASCSITGALGVCTGGACATFSCGDGVREGTERCDGADLGGATCAALGYHGETTGLACTADCLFDVTGCARTCGDGVADTEEQCDGTDLGTAADCTSLGFYEPAGLTCAPSCTWDFDQCLGFCGDNMLNGPEVCDGAPPAESCVDFGFDAGPTGCSGSCGASFAQCARLTWRREIAHAEGIATLYASGDDVWIAGPSGYIARQVNGTWTQTPTPTPEDILVIWAEGPRAWAVTVQATLLVWNGSTWEEAPAGPGGPTGVPSSLWGTGTTAVVATRDSGVYAWDGASWHELGTPGCAFLTSISGTSLADLWVGCGVAVSGATPGLYHWDGTAWALERTGPTASVAVRGSIVVRGSLLPGGDTTLEIRDQATWRSVAFPLLCDQLDIVSASDIWCGAGDLVIHYDGTRIAITDPLPFADPVSGSVVGVGSDGADGIIAATNDGNVLRTRGHLMLATATLSAGTMAIQLWSSPLDDRFVATQLGRVAVAPGDSFESWPRSDAVSPGSALRAIWGVSRNDLWAGADDGTLYHFDGASWTAEPDAFGAINALFGVDASDRWVLGDVPYHYDGTSWTARPIPGAAGGDSGAVAGPDDAWVGASLPPALYHWTNGAWELAMPLTDFATSISVVRPDLVYVAVAGHDLLVLDGGTWDNVDVPSVTPVKFVLAFARDDVFVATGREVFHFDGTRWSPIRLELADLESIVALGGRRGRVEILSSTQTVFRVRSVLRIAPWSCRPSETDCGDQVDDDCDGAIDADDGDCP